MWFCGDAVLGVSVIHLIQLIHFVARLSTRFFSHNLKSLSYKWDFSGPRKPWRTDRFNCKCWTENLYYISEVFCAEYCNLLQENIKPNYTILSIAKRDLSDIELIFIQDWDSFKMKHLERERIQIFSRVNQLKHLKNGTKCSQFQSFSIHLIRWTIKSPQLQTLIFSPN